DPEEFYDRLLKPSLGALFISQLIVFLVFPLFQRGLRWIPLVAVPSGLAAWGFYILVSGTASTWAATAARTTRGRTNFGASGVMVRSTREIVKPAASIAVSVSRLHSQ